MMWYGTIGNNFVQALDGVTACEVDRAQRSVNLKKHTLTGGQRVAAVKHRFRSSCFWVNLKVQAGSR